MYLSQTLKKAQVERHVFSCRNCWGVTCVDCNFTFEGESFRAHTSCVSEDQKYQGALYKAPKAKQQKNRGVNEIWADAVQRAAANASQGVAPKALSDNLIRMGELGNVPRQEKKFKNFIKNSFRVLNDAGVSKLWEYLDGVRQEVLREEQEAIAEKEKEGEKGAATSTPNPANGHTENGPAVGEETPKRKSPKKDDDSSKAASRADAPDSTNGAKSSGNSGKTCTSGESKQQEDGATANMAIEADPEEEGGAAVDASTRKQLMKAAIGILKKAPDKKLGVKELVKQAVLSVKKGKGGLAAGFDGKQLKRALRKRLKTCDRVEIRGSEAIYSRGSA
ncbi:unnamed protein product [Ascophyllum nodosum]